MEKDWKKMHSARSMFVIADEQGVDKWEVFEYIARNFKGEKGKKIFRDAINYEINIFEIIDRYTPAQIEGMSLDACLYLRDTCQSIKSIYKKEEPEKYEKLVNFAEDSSEVEKQIRKNFAEGTLEEKREIIERAGVKNMLCEIVRDLCREGKTLNEAIEIIEEKYAIKRDDISRELTKSRVRNEGNERTVFRAIIEMVEDKTIDIKKEVHNFDKLPENVVYWIIKEYYSAKNFYMDFSYNGKLTYDETLLLAEKYPQSVQGKLEDLKKWCNSVITKKTGGFLSKDFYKLIASSKALEECLVKAANKLIINPSDAREITPDLDKLPEIVKTSIETPWKMKSEPFMIIRDVGEENKWEALSWFAQNRPTTFRRLVGTKYFKKTDVLSHYSGQENLPQPIQEMFDEEQERLRRAEGRKQDAEDAKKNFYDLDGNLKQFFTINGKIKPQNKNDYLVIYKQFAKSNMVIPSFCKRYKIYPVEGFRKMLEVLALNDPEIAEEIKRIGETNQKRTYGKFMTSIEKIARGEQSVKDFLENTPNTQTFSLEFYIAHAKENCTLDVQLAFTRKIIEYFSNRMSKCAQPNGPEELAQLLTKKEFEFIKGDSKLNISMLQTDRLSLGDIFYRNTEFLNNYDKTFFRENVIKAKTGLRTVLGAYGVKFNKEAYLAEKTKFIINGEIVEVTEETIDKASIFVHYHKLCPTKNVYRSVIKAILEGKITDKDLKISSETPEKTNELLDRIRSAESLDEYFEAFNDEESSI